MKDMTQEEKDLLLRDLASRLPYGVALEQTYKVTVIATNEEEVLTRVINLYSINTLDDMTVSGMYNDGDEEICFLSEVKPYLFPMSSMTEEQNMEYLRTCIGGNANVPTLSSFEWCDKNHFDYRGLIPMNLAIDATKLNIY